MFERIKRYTSICSPSGYEKNIREAIIDDIKDFVDWYEVDSMGNLTAFKKGEHAPEKKTVISAHMDEVGMIVSHITDDGRIYFSCVGGIDRRVLGGKRVVIGDGQIPAVISSKAIHLQKPEEKGKCDDVANMTIDIGAQTKSEVLSCVRIGDYISFVPNYEEFGSGLVRSKAIDDRFGCAVLVEIARQKLKYDTYFAFCVCEETGCDGAKIVCSKLKPDTAIVVEATTAGDVGDVPKARRACSLREGAVISHMDNGTIYDPDVVNMLIKTAGEQGIKAQLKNIVAGGNEAKVYQTYGGGCTVAAISCPTRYIHSQACVAAKEDMMSVYKLVYAVIERGF